MLHFKLLASALVIINLPSIAQTAFTNGTSDLVNDALTSGVAMGVADMNGDGRDDIIRLNNASDLEIEYQGEDGTWTRLVFGNLGPGNEWSICVADADRNGYNDILSGGAYNDLKFLTANATGDDYTSGDLPAPDIFLQGSNFSDIDNNGTIDIFACHDDGISSPYSNDGSGTFNYDLDLINTASTIPSDNSGNYGSTWTDYDNDGDLDLYISKCRLGVSDPLDGRRVNLLFQNDGLGNYVDVAEAAGLRPLAQSWAADFADIDNDGDLDVFIINHDVPSQLFVNNGDGTFTDITAASGMTDGIEEFGYGIQCKFEDFDNDTYVDLFVTGLSGAHRLFWNDGDGTFTATDPFETDGEGIQSTAIGDLNHDGFVDLIAGFATGFNNPSDNPDRLFFNNGNENHFFNIQLTGVESNINAIGAWIELYGEWGMQVRELRAGESYGVFNSFTAHFGIGEEEFIDSVVVRWPSGEVDKVCSPAINQFYTLTEGTSVTYVLDTPELPEVSDECMVESISAPTSSALCSDEIITGIADISFPITDQGTTEITWTYEVEGESPWTQTQTVIISDISAPVPDEETLATITSECEVDALTPPTATDNCTDVTVTSDATLPITDLGTTEVTWTYEDENGNSTTQVQLVEITEIDASITQVDALTLMANAVGYSYQWLDCDNDNAPIDGATDQTFVTDMDGNYAVQIDNGLGCIVTSPCTQLFVSINEDQSNLGLRVYPNPTKGFVQIQLAEKHSIDQVRISTIDGKLIHTTSNLGQTGMLEIQGAPGIYLIEVRTTENRVTRFKVVKEG